MESEERLKRKHNRRYNSTEFAFWRPPNIYMGLSIKELYVVFIMTKWRQRKN